MCYQTQKRNPQTHLRDAEYVKPLWFILIIGLFVLNSLFWDYLGSNPESLYQVILSPRYQCNGKLTLYRSCACSLISARLEG